VIDNFRKIVENRSNLGPITLFLGAKRVFFDRRTTGYRAWGIEHGKKIEEAGYSGECGGVSTSRAGSLLSGRF